MGGKHMRTQLRVVTRQYTAGFQDAVADLGTHIICGHAVPYSRAQVYAVLKGQNTSERLLERIATRRPDMFGLPYVCEGVRAWYARRVGSPVAVLGCVAASAAATQSREGVRS
jgi:hypothetical protein